MRKNKIHGWTFRRIARPQYLLAMKCAALRLGAEFHDLDDVRYLLRYLNIGTTEQAMNIVTQYFDESRLLPKTRLALEELLTGRGPHHDLEPYEGRVVIRA